MLYIRVFLVFFTILWLSAPTLAGTYEYIREDSKSWGSIFQNLFGFTDFRKSYALVIGINRYEQHGRFDNLDGPVADAWNVRDFLKDDANFDYIKTLTDEDATYEQINYLMESFFPSKIQKGDRFFFYFSGHGVTRDLQNEKRGYLVLKKSKDWDSMIGMPRVMEWAQNMDIGRHVLFMLDACFSGLAAFQSKAGEPRDMTIERLKQPAHELISAGVENEKSFIYQGHSLFTSAFLDAARGKLGDAADDVIPLSEIMVNVNRAIDRKKAEIGYLNMTPHMYQTRQEDNAGDFFFLRNRTGLSSVVSLAAKASLTSKGDRQKVLAAVNGKVITDDDLKIAADDLRGSLPPQLDDKARDSYLLDYLINSELVAQKAQAETADQTPEFAKKLAYYREKLLMEGVLAQIAKTTATDAAVKASYDEEIKKQKPETEIHARHILVGTEDEAKAVIKRLLGGEEFEKVAKEVSKDPGSEGGDLGWFTKDRMVPEFADAAFKLDVGQISGPVKSPFGWHIIEVLDKREKTPPTFDQVKDQVSRYVVQKAQLAYVTELRKGAKIEITAPPAPAKTDKPAAGSPAPAPAGGKK